MFHIRSLCECADTPPSREGVDYDIGFGNPHAVLSARLPSVIGRNRSEVRIGRQFFVP
jgi:hypothetical protein